jgi:hypothetical protein
MFGGGGGGVVSKALCHASLWAIVVERRICVTYWHEMLFYNQIHGTKSLRHKLFRTAKEFPAFYVTRKMMTAFTKVYQRFLTHTNWVDSHIYYFFSIHFNIILLSTLRSFKWSLYFIFTHQMPVFTSFLSHTYYMPCPCHHFFIRSPQ